MPPPLRAIAACPLQLRREEGEQTRFSDLSGPVLVQGVTRSLHLWLRQRQRLVAPTDPSLPDPAVPVAPVASPAFAATVVCSANCRSIPRPLAPMKKRVSRLPKARRCEREEWKTYWSLGGLELLDLITACSQHA